MLDHPHSLFITSGLLSGTVVVTIHMETEAEIRVISAGKATRHVWEGFFKTIDDRR